MPKKDESLFDIIGLVDSLLSDIPVARDIENSTRIFIVWWYADIVQV